MENVAKTPISARVPKQLADQVESYAEAYDMTRTEAVTRLLEFAVNQSPPPEAGEGERDVDGDVNPVYTVALFPDIAEYVENTPEPGHATIQDAVREAARRAEEKDIE